MTTYAPLIGLMVFVVITGLIAQFLVTEPRWRNLLYAIVVIVTVVVLLIFLLGIFGVWHAPAIRA